MKLLNSQNDLATDLEGFYEKKGWKHITNGFDLFDDEFKIYSKATKELIETN